MGFKTIQPPQVKALTDHYADPIFTVGDTIGSYVPPGILHGIGAYSSSDAIVRLLVTHEISATDGYRFALKNDTRIPGSRISYFDIDKSTYSVAGSGLAFDTIINRNGKVVSAAADLELSGIQRFASAALIEANQFGSGIGLADRVFFSGENTFGGTQFALDIQNNTLFAAPWLGRSSWSNIAELNTGRDDRVAFLIGDDRGPAPLALYIGTKNGNHDNSFLDRNGLALGKRYVWVADDPNNATDFIEADPRDFSGTNNSTVGRFVEIKYYDPALAGTAVDGPDPDTSIQNELGYDALGFATQSQQDKLAADVKAFLFSRPQDIATNPGDGTQAVFASKGRSAIFGGKDTYGTTYRFDVDFNNIDTGDISAKVDILFDGNATKDASLRNPEDLDWAEDGKIYINESRGETAALFAGTSKQEASVWTIDPSNADPSSTLTRFAQIDRTALPATQTDSSPTDIGNWETSGILDVSSLFGASPNRWLVLNVQAHSLRNGTIITATNIDGNGDGSVTRQENLVEGGQLLFLSFPPPPPVASISTTTTSQAEGDIGSTLFPFTITRTGSLTSESSVSWAVVGSGESPAAGSDFAGGLYPTGTAVFAPGQASVSLSISVVGDGLLEADEGFRIEISNPVGAQLSATTSTDLIQIVNDDSASKTYTVTASSSIVYEGSSLNIGVATTNVASGTRLYWQATGTNITASDFSSGGLSGEVLIGSDGRASFAQGIAADPLVDPDEVLEFKFYRDAALSQQVGNAVSITIKEASVGVVTDGNDIITGTAAGEVITGVPVGSSLRGRGSRDELTGGGGDDIFALGDSTGAYYDDGLSANRGTADLAVIKDFSVGDRIQLWGDNTKYTLVSALNAGIRGVRIDLNPQTPGGLGEAIGFVQTATLASLNLTNSSQFLYL